MGAAPDSRPGLRPQSSFEASGIEEGIMSYDALMRWEWEGGAPATVSDRGQAERTEPGKDSTIVLKQVAVPVAIPPKLAAADV